MYVYGGPANPTVNDAWGGTRYLWHQILAQQGYVVASVDNRGAAWRGRDFRKVTQYHLGMSSRTTRSTPPSGSAGSRGSIRRASASGGGATVAS